MAVRKLPGTHHWEGVACRAPGTRGEKKPRKQEDRVPRQTETNKKKKRKKSTDKIAKKKRKKGRKSTSTDAQLFRTPLRPELRLAHRLHFPRVKTRVKILLLLQPRTLTWRFLCSWRLQFLEMKCGSVASAHRCMDLTGGRPASARLSIRLLPPVPPVVSASLSPSLAERSVLS